MDELFMDEFDVLYPVSLSLGELREIVAQEFEIKKDYYAFGTNIPTFIIKRIDDNKKLNEAFNRIQKIVSEKNTIALLRKIPKSERISIDTSKYLSLKFLPIKRAGQNKIIINIALLLATIGTVLLAALFIIFTDPLYYPNFINTLPGLIGLIGYAASILCIIGIHELGHLTLAKIHKIKSSLPYFIPFLPPIGTMGAVILQKTPPKNKNELFDIGIAGPLFGFIVSIIVGIIGFMISQMFLKMDYIHAYSLLAARLPSWLVGEPVHDWVNVSSSLPDPLIFYIFSWIFFKDTPPVSPTGLNLITFNNSTMYVYVLHSISFAAWVGFFVTGLNLMPIAQLDGGHVIRAVLGEKYYKIAAYISLVILFIINPIFAILILALSRFSVTHPGPLNDVTPLSKSRKIASIIFFIMLILTIPLGSLFLSF